MIWRYLKQFLLNCHSYIHIWYWYIHTLLYVSKGRHKVFFNFLFCLFLNLLNNFPVFKCPTNIKTDKPLENQPACPLLKFIKKYHKAEYVQRRVCFVNVHSSLHENVIFFLCACMDNAAYITFIMWNSIFGLFTWYFHFNISCGVAVMVRSHQQKCQVNS